jgi:cell division protease FtsH
MPRLNKRLKNPQHRLMLVALGLFTFLLVLMLARPAEPVATEISLSDALDHVKDGDVKRAILLDGSADLYLYLDDDVKTRELAYDDDGTPKETKLKTPKEGRVHATFPFRYADDLMTTMLDSDVPVGNVAPPPPSTVRSVLIALLPVVLIGALLVWMLKSGALTGGNVSKMGGGRGNQIGEVPEARFSDVAGADEAVTDLTELVRFLSNPDPFLAVGAKAPRGALLVGPPGTGKTLLARAVAGEAGVPFFALAGSDFVETFVGVGARRVRNLWDAARKAGGAIIFIDEIDAVGRARAGAGGPGGGDSERENTLISMLNEMDGFDGSHRIIVLAATNRADILDPALTRPGRLDRLIQVPAPDRRGREQILKVHTAGKPIGDDVDLNRIALRTPGMAGADLEQVVNEACMEAVRAGVSVVSGDHFDAALATVALGRARTSALVTPQDRLITAWHEAGHTVAALLQEAADDPVSVSIVPRGPAGGVTWMSGSDDVFLTRAKALAQLRVSMAGRAAEELLLDGEYTQGAHGDLSSATSLALAMVTKYGMSKAGYLNVDDDTVRMGGEVAAEVRRTANDLLEEAHTDAHALLVRHRDLLEAVADQLLIDESLNKHQINAIRSRLSGESSAD